MRLVCAHVYQGVFLALKFIYAVCVCVCVCMSHACIGRESTRGIYICMYVCMYACMHAGRKVGMHVYVCMYMCVAGLRALSISP